MSSYQDSFSFVVPASPGGETLRLSYISQARYSQEWNSNLHTHGCAELFFITEGHGRFRTQREEFPVALHDLIIINANVPHTELSQPKNPLEYIVLGVACVEVLGSADGYAMFHLQSGWQELMGCLDLMLRETQEQQPGCEEVCRHLLEVVLLRLGRQGALSLGAQAAGPRVSRECGLVRRYIDNHFKEDLNLDQLAQLAHVNKYYLAHAFRREFGESPIHYLISRRVEESKFLLRETDHTLSFISRVLGFSSPSYFSQCFRRVEGISPVEYRRQSRQGTR
ncbi:MAG: AraC family transcriptional regulator [Subdoligranulum sp.]|nr:AraC family transcriptional regulator [Subdoligranulum sp.]